MQQPSAGRSLRDTQLALFQARDTAFLETCRAVAVEVIKRKGSVSINDIRARLMLPPGTHPSVLGAVFRDKRFKVIGIVEASHPEAHARMIRVYTLKEST